MPDSTNDPQLLKDKIRSRVNQAMHYSAQIMPDDPVLSVLVINNALFQEYIDTLTQTLTDLQAKQTVLFQSHVDMGNRSFEHKLEMSTDHLKREVNKVVQAGEARIKSTAQYEVVQMQQITQISYIAAAFWFAAGVATLGSILFKILGFG